MKENELSSSKSKRVRIRKEESELPKRIREAIGDDSVASFSRRCGVNEAAIRKYFAGTVPSSDNLVAMADAANVNIEWLAAGRGAKMRGAGVVQPISALPPPSALDMERLELALRATQEALDNANGFLPPKKHAQMVLACYEIMEDMDSEKDLKKVVKFMRRNIAA